MQPKPLAPTQRKRAEQLARFVQERIAVAGDVSEQALIRAGFPLEEVEQLRPALAGRPGLGFAG